MKRVLICVVLFSGSVFADAVSELDKPYFGLEFADSKGGIVVANVDLDHRTARKLQPHAAVLSVNGNKFDTAAKLQQWLDGRGDNEFVRIEVLGVNDRVPDKVPVRADSLRTLLPRRFRKERDREAKQMLHIPKLPGSQLHVAVAEGYDGKTIGIKLRYYPKDSNAVPSKDLVFRDGRHTSLSSRCPFIETKPEEFHYSGLSEQDQQKIPTLSRSQLLKIQREAYVEFQIDRTEEILREVDFGSLAQIGYRDQKLFSINHHTLDANERRNVKSCLLLYEMLTEADKQKDAAVEPPSESVSKTGRSVLPASALKKAEAGWGLWQAGKYSGGTQDGFYTDPDKTTQVKDFWSDGSYARVDDTNDGMFETIFRVENSKLVHIGTLERPFIFRHIVMGQEQAVKDYLDRLRGRQQRR